MPATFRRLFLWAASFCFGVMPAHAQPLVLTDPNKSYSLFERFSVLEVKHGTATIDSLLRHPKAYAFRPGQQQTFRLNDPPKSLQATAGTNQSDFSTLRPADLPVEF